MPVCAPTPRQFAVNGSVLRYFLYEVSGVLPLYAAMTTDTLITSATTRMFLLEWLSGMDLGCPNCTLGCLPSRGAICRVFCNVLIDTLGMTLGRIPLGRLCFNDS